MGCVECGASTRSDWVRRVRDDGSLRSAEWRARSEGGEELDTSEGRVDGVECGVDGEEGEVVARSEGGEEWGTSEGGVDGEVGQVVARSECGEEWGTSEGGVEWVVGE